MQHEGRMLVAVLSDIRRVQTFWDVAVDLQCTTLPIAPDCVGQHEFELWPVERAFTFLNFIVVARGLTSIAERCFKFVPDVIRADPLFWPCGQFDRPVGEAKLCVDCRKEFDEDACFVFDLFFCAEDVPVVLGKAAHAHDTVQRA